MKKILCAATAMIVAISFTNCNGSTQKGGSNDSDSVAVDSTSNMAKSVKSDAADTLFYVGEGTAMHSLQLFSFPFRKDTIDVAMDDNTQKKGQLIIGNIVKVKFGVGEGGNKVATLIENADDDYTNFYVSVIGNWTKPDPINKNKKMGVCIDVNGLASSINMATLPYSSWDVLDEPKGTGKIRVLLVGKSIGNHNTEDVADTAVVDLDAKPHTMTMKANNTVYTLE